MTDKKGPLREIAFIYFKKSTHACIKSHLPINKDGSEAVDDQRGKKLITSLVGLYADAASAVAFNTLLLPPPCEAQLFGWKNSKILHDHFDWTDWCIFLQKWLKWMAPTWTRTQVADEDGFWLVVITFTRRVVTGFANHLSLLDSFAAGDRALKATSDTRTR